MSFQGLSVTQDDDEGNGNTILSLSYVDSIDGCTRLFYFLFSVTKFYAFRSLSFLPRNQKFSIRLGTSLTIGSRNVTSEQVQVLLSVFKALYLLIASLFTLIA